MIKINDTGRTPLKPDWTTEKANVERQSAVTPQEMNGDEAASETLTGGERRSFASVLEEVSRNERQQSEGHEETEGDREESKSPEQRSSTRVGREEEKRDEDATGRGQGGFGEARGGSFREAIAAADPTSARAILHLADLERIVAAVRAQTVAATNRREIVIELRRSVLEGLRVKLSTDPQGRVTAELIAASERVRGQLDARSAELAELMRSRGINLASLRTSLSADTSSHDSSPDADRRAASEQTTSVKRGSAAHSAEAPAGMSDDAAAEEDEPGGAIYRA